MLNDGLFKKFPRPDYALALHCNATRPYGTIGFTPALVNDSKLTQKTVAALRDVFGEDHEPGGDEPDEQAVTQRTVQETYCRGPAASPVH